MARKSLPQGEKKEVIQTLLKGSYIELLGGKKECSKLAAEFLELKAKEKQA